MRSFQTVTVGMSLTSADREVLQYASVVARLGVTGQMRFVHVAGQNGRRELPLSDEDALRRLRSLVSRHFQEPGHELRTSCLVVEGAGVESLAGSVLHHDSELLLLGKRRWRSHRDPPTLRLATAAACPIWTVPRRASARITRILAPVDFSDHSADSLSQAAAISCLHGIEECLALHVIDLATASNGAPASDDEPLRRRFMHFLKSVNTHGVHIVLRLVQASQVAPAILSHARLSSADLIVLSTRGEGPANTVAVGTVASRILQESDVPVLAVRQFRTVAPHLEGRCPPTA